MTVQLMKKGPERFSRSADQPPSRSEASLRPLVPRCQGSTHWGSQVPEWSGMAEGEEETEGRRAERPAHLGQVQRGGEGGQVT